MVKQLLTSAYEIKRIIGGPKYVEENGKKVSLYKVRWQDTYEPASNLPKAEVSRYNTFKQSRVKVLGPVFRGQSTPELHKMQFAVEYDNHIHIHSYSKVKEDFKDELIEYFEKCATAVAPETPSEVDSNSSRSGSGIWTK